MNNIYIYYNFDRQNSQLKKMKKTIDRNDNTCYNTYQKQR